MTTTNQIQEMQLDKLTGENVISLVGGFLSRFIWDYFCYIDVNANGAYAFERVKSNINIPIKKLNKHFIVTDTNCVVGFAKVRKKYSRMAWKFFFPEMHVRNLVLGGTEYREACEEVITAFNRGIEELARNMIESVEREK